MLMRTAVISLGLKLLIIASALAEPGSQQGGEFGRTGYRSLNSAAVKLLRHFEIEGDRRIQVGENGLLYDFMLRMRQISIS